jgi:ArsR family transcriptional regulator, arsenate/arsenite/antimonite-responsive transcriptional repressor
MSVPVLRADHVDLAGAADTLRFLGDGNRLRILLLLAREERCVCDLIDALGLPQPLVSYHLGKLRKAGIVRTRRDSHWVYYSIDPSKLETALAPLSALLALTPLPPEARYGANRRCDDLLPEGP